MNPRYYYHYARQSSPFNGAALALMIAGLADLLVPIQHPTPRK